MSRAPVALGAAPPALALLLATGPTAAQENATWRFLGEPFVGVGVCTTGICATPLPQTCDAEGAPSASASAAIPVLPFGLTLADLHYRTPRGIGLDVRMEARGITAPLWNPSKKRGACWMRGGGGQLGLGVEWIHLPRFHVDLDLSLGLEKRHAPYLSKRNNDEVVTFESRFYGDFGLGLRVTFSKFFVIPRVSYGDELRRWWREDREATLEWTVLVGYDWFPYSLGGDDDPRTRDTRAAR